MTNPYKRFYYITLVLLMMLSAYPLGNGIRMIYLCLQRGYILPQEYAQYVIPYAAICFSILFFTIYQPVIMKIFNRFQLIILTLFSTGVFVIVEQIFEKIKILNEDVLPASGYRQPVEVDLWQAYSCVGRLPETVSDSKNLELIDGIFQGKNGLYYVFGTPAYKFHYYMISIIIIMMFTAAIYGLGKMFFKEDYREVKPVVMQACTSIILISLCIFANITGFFRDLSQIQNPVASLLTCIFFVTLGSSFGIYFGSFLIKRNKIAGIFVLVLSAIIITAAMYFGESILLNGSLYRFGTGWLFRELPYVTLALADITVIILSGIFTYLILISVRREKNKSLN